MVEQSLPQIMPLPGWVEQDPMVIWQTQLATLRKALAQAQLTIHDIHAIGINVPSDSTVVWNRMTGQPIYNAITEQDQRCESSQERQQWILDHVYNAYTQKQAGELVFGTLGNWLLWQLTGNTESHHAATHILGTTHSAILGASIPITAVTESAESIPLGQACFSPDIVTLTYGNEDTRYHLLHLHTGEKTRFPCLLSPAQCLSHNGNWHDMATLQTTAFQTTALLRALERKASLSFKELRVSGPASKNDWLLQMQADLLGIPVSRPVIAYPSALGVAYLAGLHSGFYHDTEEIKTQWKADKTFQPIMNQDTAHQIMMQWERALHQVMQFSP